MLRGLDHGVTCLDLLIVFQQRSALQYPRDPFLEARELQNPSYASCVKGNLAAFDRGRGRCGERQLRWEAAEQL